MSTYDTSTANGPSSTAEQAKEKAQETAQQAAGQARGQIRTQVDQRSTQAGEKVSHADLACFDDWAEVRSYVEDDPGGSDLRTMVKMLDDYGPQIVIDALTGLVAEDAADVVISTGHRSKGREWASVRLAGDFQDYEGSPIPPEELRLLYVAATRATHHLDLSGCAPLRRLLAGVDR